MPHKRILGALALILTLCVLASSMAIVDTSESDFSLSSDESRPAPTKDNYELYDEFSISTVEEMNTFISVINSYGYTYAGKIVYLAADLDYTGKTQTAASTNQNYKFNGTFDGQGHVISNYTQALFGYIYGAVCNLGLNGAITSVPYGLASYNYGVISNCYNIGSITCSSAKDCSGFVLNNSGVISDCYFAGTIVNTYASIPCAYGFSSNSGYIENCYNVGSLSAPEGRVYGLCQLYNTQNIVNSYSLSDTPDEYLVSADALKTMASTLGPMYTDDVNNINNGYPILKSQSGEFPAVVSFNLNNPDVTTPITPQVLYPGEKTIKPDDPKKQSYTFAGWYSDKELTNEFDFNSTVTSNTILYAKWNPNLYTVTFETNGGSAIDSIQVAYGDSIPRPADPVKDGYEFRSWVTYDYQDMPGHFIFETSSVDGRITLYADYYKAYSEDLPAPTADNYKQYDAFAIRTVNDLLEFASLVNDHDLDYTGKAVYLANDLDLTNVEFLPIGLSVDFNSVRKFSGTFDGLGHTISNLSIYLDNNTEGSDCAFFGRTGSAKLCNFGLINPNIRNDQAYGYAGGIVCNASDTIIYNCYVDGGSIIQDENGGSESTNNVAGIVAEGSGEIRYCYNSAEITGYSGGHFGRAGGISAYWIGIIKECYNTGNVTAWNNGDAEVSGIVTVGTCDVIDCYNSGNITGVNYSEYDYFSGSGIGSAIITNSYNSGTVVYCKGESANGERSIISTSPGSGIFVGLESYDYIATNTYYLDSSAAGAGFKNSQQDDRVPIIGDYAKTSAEMQSPEFAKLLGDAWTMPSEGDYKYPVLKWQVFGIPDNNEQNPAADDSGNGNGNGNRALLIYLLVIIAVILICVAGWWLFD